MDTSDLVNADVTTLITLVSDITNDPDIATRFGNVNIWKDKYESVYRHIIDEQKNPVILVLNEIIHNRKIVATDTAYDKFVELISNNGSKSEIERMNKLIVNIHKIKSNPSERFKKLMITNPKTWSELNVDIFGTADRYNITTLSGNIKLCKFIHNNLDVDFEYHAHRPRCFVGSKFEKNLIK